MAVTAAGKSTEAITKTTLGNGLRVVTEPIVGSRSASIGAWFAIGSRDETPERSGSSHFLEHLLFKGTEARSARDVAEAIDRVGGDMNAFTAREHTAFYARVPSSSTAMATELLMEVLRRPALRATDIDAERQVITEELVAAYDTPDDLVHIALYEALFPGHALGREVLGDTDTIMALDRHAIAEFHDRWYRPANTVIAASGDVDHDLLVDAAERFFGDLEVGERPTRHEAPASNKTMVCTTLPVEQLHVALGWRSLGHGDPRRYALAIANQILGGSPSSRLFQGIREDQALAYTVYSSTSGYSDAGSASVYAATSTERGPELLNALETAMTQIVEHGVTEYELELARTGFEGSVILGLEDSGSRMVRLATGEALRGAIVSIDSFLEALAAVTVDDVNSVIAEVYGQPAVTSLVGSPTALTRCGCG
ncbi:MAG: M16 family metallopeptidase [Acidimicrobiales bacterium]